MNQIVLEFKEDLPPEIVEKGDLKERLAAMLYHTGDLSGGEAATLLGIPRETFERAVLPRYHIPMLDDRDLEIEKKGAGFLDRMRTF